MLHLSTQANCIHKETAMEDSNDGSLNYFRNYNKLRVDY